MLYRVPKFFNVNYIFIIGLWCNGSTIDFGSICLGSNPNKPAKHQNLFLIFFVGFVYRLGLKIFIFARGVRFSYSIQGRVF